MFSVQPNIRIHHQKHKKKPHKTDNTTQKFHLRSIIINLNYYKKHNLDLNLANENTIFTGMAANCG